jgi:phage tail protein X
MQTTTRHNDMLDAICHRHYGRVDVVPIVLEANRHLAKQPPVLPDGLTITLPELGAKPAAPIVRLWS